MTVVVTALVKLRPDAREEALTALTRGIAATHTEEGNIAYALHEDRSQPAHFVIVEKWESQEALQAHGETPHLKAMFAELGEKGRGGGEVAAAPELGERARTPELYS